MERPSRTYAYAANIVTMKHVSFFLVNSKLVFWEKVTVLSVRYFLSNGKVWEPIDAKRPLWLNESMAKKELHPTVVDPVAQAKKYERAMHFRFQGKTSNEIAKELGVTAQRVRVWFATGGALHERYEVFARNQRSLIKDTEIRSVTEMIVDEAPKSLRTIVKIRDKKDVNPATRFIAAKDLLDRAGYAPVQKTANVHLVEEMSADELNKTFQTFVDAAKVRKKSK